MINLIATIKGYFMKAINKNVRDVAIYNARPETLSLIEVVTNPEYHDTVKVFINGLDVAYVEPTGEVMQLNDGHIISQWHILIKQNGFIVDSGEYAWDDTLVSVEYPVAVYKPHAFNVWEAYIEGMELDA